MATFTTIRAEAIVEQLDVHPSAEQVVVKFAKSSHPAMLESSSQQGSYDRYSFFACEPIGEFSHRVCDDGYAPQSLFDRTKTLPDVTVPPGAPPFVGGWIGYLSYESGAALEKTVGGRRYDDRLPLAQFHLYDTVAVLDHSTDKWSIAAIDWAGALPGRPSAIERLHRLKEQLQEAERETPASVPAPFDPRPATCNMSYDDYLAKTNRALAYIRAGDIYQVNLTQRWTTQCPLAPVEVYRRLRRISPSSHAAFLSCGDTTIISSSPELFLDLRARAVLTRPIKGTRPRVGDQAIDSASRLELEQSGKERAELTMIVDLLRNDLGRVCRYGSIRVVDPGCIETHPNLYHRTATIAGTLDVGRNWCDLLTATFPGGSVTGAPKVRAMQIINELESTPRGVYCGSIGWIGLDGAMSMNIAIRTMLQRGSDIDLYAGGAIVADSDPEAEYQESLVKAAGMLHAVGCVTDGSPIPAGQAAAP